MTANNCMRFYMNILTTYFPDRDPPYDIYYHQILEQIELAEEWAGNVSCSTNTIFWAMGGPARLRHDDRGHLQFAGKSPVGGRGLPRGLKRSGLDPEKRRCQFHI